MRPLAIIDLVIPGLFNLPTDELSIAFDRQPMPFLHRLLRFANWFPTAVENVDALLIQRLQLEQSGLPYAQAVRPGSKSALLFRPVHLQAGLNNAIVHPVDLNEESSILINDLSDYFKVDCDIEELPGSGWIMHLHQVEPVYGTPNYWSVLGKKLTHYLEPSANNLDWFKLFNEMQMFLHQHPLNLQREAQGQASINSLWCWGADAYRNETCSDIDWYADDPLFRALGNLYTGRSAELSEFNTAAAGVDKIVIMLSLLKYLKGENDQNVVFELARLERLLASSMSGNHYRIRLHTGSDQVIEYRPMHRFRRWRPVQSLLALMSQAILLDELDSI